MVQCNSSSAALYGSQTATVLKVALVADTRGMAPLKAQVLDFTGFSKSRGLADPKIVLNYGRIEKFQS